MHPIILTYIVVLKIIVSVLGVTLFSFLEPSFSRFEVSETAEIINSLPFLNSYYKRKAISILSGQILGDLGLKNYKSPSIREQTLRFIFINVLLAIKT